MTDQLDEPDGSTVDEYLSNYLLINFDAYFKGKRTDRKGEMILTFGVPMHYRIEDETKKGLADLDDWGGFTFSVILTREKIRSITIDAQEEE